MSVLGAAGIGLLGNLVTTGINYGIQQQNWNQQVAYEQATYDRNRRDYLADLENERAYNSAQAQIDRIREAGLNTNLLNGGSLVSGQGSSAATPMSMGAAMSMSPVRMGDFSSGVAASSDAMVKQRKLDEELYSIQLSNSYKEIELQYLHIEKNLANAETIARTDEQLASAKKHLSDIDVNNSTIEVNGKRIELISSQIDKNVREAALIQAKTVVENLNADKLRSILPYVADLQKAELVLREARPSISATTASA